MTHETDTPAPADLDATAPSGKVYHYPEHWVADVLASDGRAVRMRPITPDDGDKLVEFHSTLSERTRYLRYFGPYPTMSTRDVRHFTHLDYVRRVGMVMELGDKIIAVGSYEGLDNVDDGKSAEVAFVVADNHQGRGLGPVLLEHLAGAAAENGLERFVAEVLAENRHMVSVFREAGYQVSRSYDGGVVHLEFDIDPTEALLSVRNARERAAEARSVRNVLTPRSIAVIGASTDPSKVGHAVLRNLLGAGFTGPVFPVNAEHRSVRGVRAYASVRDIPDDLDLAVVAVPAEAMDEVFEDCLAKEVKALVVVSAGFSETGPDGQEQERRLVRAARAHGMRVVGPNALGVANTDTAVGLNSTLAPVLPGRGRIGFFCQSGALGIQILDGAAKRRLGLSTFVSAGNRGDVSGNDVLQYWDTDPDTDVVLLYLESFGNPRKFSRIARRVARGKPVVAVKSGRHAVPPALAATGVEIDDATVRALFEQSGVIHVDSIAQLFDCAQVLAYQPLPRGPRVAIVGNSTALGVLAADAVRSEGLDAGDPVDLGARATPEEFADAVTAAVRSEWVDAVMAVFVPPIAVAPEPYAAALRDAAQESAKPIVTTFLAEEGIPDMLAVHDDGGNPARGSVPSYPGPERAATSLARAWRYSRWLDVPVSTMTRPDGIDTERARALVHGWLAERGQRQLTDSESTSLLACYGIGVVPYVEVADGPSAREAAENIGYPVALKARAADWRRRPDLMGVRLDLSSAEAVGDAYADVSELSGSDVVQVQKMAPKGINCVISVQDDPSFGSVISFGLAGVISTLLGDRAYRVLPVTEDEALELIDAPKGAPLLHGYGFGAPVDKGALVDMVHRVSALIDDIPEVRELVCEPILASAEGVAVLETQVRIGHEPRPVDLGPRRLR
ncbi:bifunctional acetate--CoA ligase family protein/GNAT family N-acetyltransferase [Tomitella gaofuii]|uniref:bifunctional acetate--CoA ligase family protein/GNAT family N-acetyltransferase n=1 Tax=Tomitella gaofuii TaxID=2760083 RepID=UPI0015F9AFE5|nr:bifunctional GNAT family N-acetyltransferase/acetate--CoA ligase family protein [Tomitella gaofuii]